MVEKRRDGREQVQIDTITVVQTQGNKCLWVDGEGYLTPSEAAELITHLQAWVETGSLELKQTGGAGK